MKRFLLFLVVVGLLAGQASAALWTLDHATAAQFTTGTVIATGDGDNLTNFSVHQYPDAGYGVSWGGGSIGFRGDLADGTSGDMIATASISDTSPSLSGTGYDGITGYFTNDNDDTWYLQLFYDDGSGPYNSGAFQSVIPGNTVQLTVNAPGGMGSLDLSTITQIGFNIQGSWPTQSGSDTFHVSVPVPGAILLGVLGLGVAGIKLRKFA